MQIVCRKKIRHFVQIFGVFNHLFKAMRLCAALLEDVPF